jgi:hypothetical protein
MRRPSILAAATLQLAAVAVSRPAMALVAGLALGSQAVARALGIIGEMFESAGTRAAAMLASAGTRAAGWCESAATRTIHYFTSRGDRR